MSEPLDDQLLGLLACPKCKGPLTLHRSPPELVCPADRLVFAVLDGVPILLTAEGRPLERAEATRSEQVDPES